MSKERLTVRCGEKVYCLTKMRCAPKCDDCEHMTEMMNKLAEYEDLEEQGLLLQLPCRVGDVVYCPCGTKIYEKKIICFMHCGYTTTAFLNVELTESCKMCDFGETVFLTKAEAEEKLRELEGK